VVAWPHLFSRAILCFANSVNRASRYTRYGWLVGADGYYSKKSSSTIAMAINVGVPLVAERR